MASENRNCAFCKLPVILTATRRAHYLNARLPVRQTSVNTLRNDSCLEPISGIMKFDKSVKFTVQRASAEVVYTVDSFSLTYLRHNQPIIHHPAKAATKSLSDSGDTL